MKKILFVISILILWLPTVAKSSNYNGEKNGYILLQVEEHGEAWYVYPKNNKRYYLGRPTDAFDVMKKLSLGATHDYITKNETFPKRLQGIILLDTEKNGEAYYIYPGDLKKYYLGRPSDAFKIMQNLGLGISNERLATIPTGDIEKNELISVTSKKILLDVPFTPQAPFGDWQDQRQQDGCEESSSLMAIKWALGESLSREEALKKIIESSEYTQKKYGEYRDIGLRDIVDWIFKDFFNYALVELKKNISIDDIINELKNNHLVITPMNGQLLHNPYFTQPGPIRHMIVIKGYNPETNTFITNDPGTRNGESYEYNVNILYDAIRDYPTGYHEKIINIEKNMIVITK